MNLIDRACNLYARTRRPWIVVQAFHVHPETFEHMQAELHNAQICPWPPGNSQLTHLKGVPVVRDPRVPPRAVALQFKNVTGWPLVT